MRMKLYTTAFAILTTTALLAQNDLQEQAVQNNISNPVAINYNQPSINVVNFMDESPSASVALRSNGIAWSNGVVGNQAISSIQSRGGSANRNRQRSRGTSNKQVNRVNANPINEVNVEQSESFIQVINNLADNEVNNDLPIQQILIDNVNPPVNDNPQLQLNVADNIGDLNIQPRQGKELKQKGNSEGQLAKETVEIVKEPKTREAKSISLPKIDLPTINLPKLNVGNTTKVRKHRSGIEKNFLKKTVVAKLRRGFARIRAQRRRKIKFSNVCYIFK